jgi:hypothetical protein
MNFKQAKTLAIIATLTFFGLLINANVNEITTAYGNTGAAYFNAGAGAVAVLFAIGLGKIKE